MKKFSTRELIFIAILASIAGVLMFPIFEIRVPFAPPEIYKFDFSEIPVIIGAFAINPIAGVVIEAVKIIIALIIKGGSVTMGVGEVANFLIGIAYVVPASYIYHKHKTRKNAVIGMLVGTLSIIIVGALLNAFVLLPVYAYFFNIDVSVLIGMGSVVNGAVTNLFTFIMLITVPFNLMKGLLISIIVFLIYKRISMIIKAKDKQ
ncbi:ECF transporter S component [Candidatus Izemoplasma sp. B36]|uniref:ECF transporter S component n=1 Tax=Candidatus Izemoplasma sp. B36 TaxID=3242468 RepID=UPI003558C77B